MTKEIKFGDIEHFTLLDLQDFLNKRSLNKLGLEKLDALRYEVSVKAEAIMESKRHGKDNMCSDTQS